MASPRRSPRLKGLSPAPKGPGPKPQPPRRRVKDPAEDSVRQAVYAAELAAWEQASKEHVDIMKVRHRAKTAAWKAARKKSAAESDAPPPAAPAPPPQLSADELRLVSDSSPALAERRLAAAAVPPPPPEKVRHPRLRRSFAKWLLDVEEVAKRCGAGRAQVLHPEGRWFDEDDWADAGEDWNRKPGRPHPAQTPARRAYACYRSIHQHVRNLRVGGRLPNYHGRAARDAAAAA